MMNSNLPRFAFLLASAFLALPAAAYNHTDVVPPKAQGPFNVACSNIAQNASAIAPGASASDYWEGRDHYITDILSYPDTAVTYTVRVPFDPIVYPGNFGRNVDFAAIVCYPTPASNNDPNYALPGSTDVIPHMQAPGARPKIVSNYEYRMTLVGGTGFDIAYQRLPLIIFSHGLTGSPISPGYVSAMVLLASHGFMVAATFHGDPRFSRVRIEDLSDFAYAVVNFNKIVEMQLMRPLSLVALTDTLLANPDYAIGIDTDRIGGFGASLGGEAMMHLLGADITTTLGFACHSAPGDPRIKAAVGLVPYAGQTFLPAFCEGQNGASKITRPFLALSGTADTTAPIKMMDIATRKMQGSHYLIELEGVPHEYKPEYAGDLFTWMVTFLDAYLDVREDPTAMARLIRMKTVTGGPQDNLRIDVHVASSTSYLAGELPAIEYKIDALNHYFLASNPDEIAIVDSGRVGPWYRTGQRFKIWAQMPPDAFTNVGPVCRFYGAWANSHFFTAVPSECTFVKSGVAGPWAYEGTAFYIRPVDLPSLRCPDGYIGVNRAYNQRAAQNDSNHRFSTSDSTMHDMEVEGWAYEATVMCARP